VVSNPALESELRDFVLDGGLNPKNIPLYDHFA
jgi:hypothetical protein